MKYPILALGFILAAGSLSAQEAPKWVAIQGGAATRSANDFGKLGDSAIAGLSGGLWITPRWGAELSFLGSQVKDGEGNTANEYHGQISGLLNLSPNPGPWVPYLRAGLGATRFAISPLDSENTTITRFSYNAGLGLQRFQGEHLLLGLEGRAMRLSLSAQNSFTETMGLVTVGYRWGRKAAPMVMTEPEPIVEPPPPLPLPREPEVLPPPPLPPPPPPPPPAKIILDEARLHFANGKAEVPSAGVEAIAKVAHSLEGYPGEYLLVVSGYTSSKGGRAFNLALSKRRADAVAQVLVASGLPASSIQTVGRGPDDPIADNGTQEGQDRNRRVEIEIRVASDNVERRKAIIPAHP